MAGKVCASLTVTKRDGTTANHVAEFVRYHIVADGIVAVEGMCCNDEKTRSRHTLPFDVATKTDDEIMAEITGHLDRVAQGHGARQRAHDLLETLAPSPSPDPLPLQPLPLTSNSGTGGVH